MNKFKLIENNTENNITDKVLVALEELGSSENNEG